MKMKAMLDYLVLAKAETVASAQDSVVESSFQFVADVRSYCAAVAWCLVLGAAAAAVRRRLPTLDVRVASHRN